MTQNNLFSFNRKPLSKQNQKINILKPIRNRIASKVDQQISDKSAQNFLESIALGNLYQELKPKEQIHKSNLTQI